MRKSNKLWAAVVALCFLLQLIPATTLTATAATDWKVTYDTAEYPIAPTVQLYNLTTERYEQLEFSSSQSGGTVTMTAAVNGGSRDEYAAVVRCTDIEAYIEGQAQEIYERGGEEITLDEARKQAREDFEMMLQLLSGEELSMLLGLMAGSKTTVEKLPAGLGSSFNISGDLFADCEQVTISIVDFDDLTSYAMADINLSYWLGDKLVPLDGSYNMGLAGQAFAPGNYEVLYYDIFSPGGRTPWIFRDSFTLVKGAPHVLPYRRAADIDFLEGESHGTLAVDLNAFDNTTGFSQVMVLARPVDASYYAMCILNTPVDNPAGSTGEDPGGQEYTPLYSGTKELNLSPGEYDLAMIITEPRTYNGAEVELYYLVRPADDTVTIREGQTAAWRIDPLSTDYFTANLQCYDAAGRPANSFASGDSVRGSLLITDRNGSRIPMLLGNDDEDPSFKVRLDGAEPAGFRWDVIPVDHLPTEDGTAIISSSKESLRSVAEMNLYSFSFTAEKSGELTASSELPLPAGAPSLDFSAGCKIYVDEEPDGDTVAPSVPTNLTVDVAWNDGQSDCAAVFSFGASTDNVGVTAYKLYRVNADGGAPKLVETKPTPGTTIAIDRLLAKLGETKGTWYFAVAAVDAAGNESALSKQVTVSNDRAPVGVAYSGAALAGGVLTLNASGATADLTYTPREDTASLTARLQYIDLNNVQKITAPVDMIKAGTATGSTFTAAVAIPSDAARLLNAVLSDGATAALNAAIHVQATLEITGFPLAAEFDGITLQKSTGQREAISFDAAGRTVSGDTVTYSFGLPRGMMRNVTLSFLADTTELALSGTQNFADDKLSLTAADMPNIGKLTLDVNSGSVSHYKLNATMTFYANDNGYLGSRVISFTGDQSSQSFDYFYIAPRDTAKFDLHLASANSEEGMTVINDTGLKALTHTKGGRASCSAQLSFDVGQWMYLNVQLPGDHGALQTSLSLTLSPPWTALGAGDNRVYTAKWNYQTQMLDLEGIPQGSYDISYVNRDGYIESEILRGVYIGPETERAPAHPGDANMLVLPLRYKTYIDLNLSATVAGSSEIFSLPYTAYYNKKNGGGWERFGDHTGTRPVYSDAIDVTQGVRIVVDSTAAAAASLKLAPAEYILALGSTANIAVIADKGAELLHNYHTTYRLTDQRELKTLPAVTVKVTTAEPSAADTLNLLLRNKADNSTINHSVALPAASVPFNGYAVATLEKIPTGTYDVLAYRGEFDAGRELAFLQNKTFDNYQQVMRGWTLTAAAADLALTLPALPERDAHLNASRFYVTESFLQAGQVVRYYLNFSYTATADQPAGELVFTADDGWIDPAVASYGNAQVMIDSRRLPVAIPPAAPGDTVRIALPALTAGSTMEVTAAVCFTSRAGLPDATPLMATAEWNGISWYTGAYATGFSWELPSQTDRRKINISGRAPVQTGTVYLTIKGSPGAATESYKVSKLGNWSGTIDLPYSGRFGTETFDLEFYCIAANAVRQPLGATTITYSVPAKEVRPYKIEMDYYTSYGKTTISAEDRTDLNALLQRLNRQTITLDGTYVDNDITVRLYFPPEQAKVVGNAQLAVKRNMIKRTYYFEDADTTTGILAVSFPALYFGEYYVDYDVLGYYVAPPDYTEPDWQAVIADGAAFLGMTEAETRDLLNEELELGIETQEMSRTTLENVPYTSNGVDKTAELTTTTTVSLAAYDTVAEIPRTPIDDPVEEFDISRLSPDAQRDLAGAPLRYFKASEIRMIDEGGGDVSYEQEFEMILDLSGLAAELNPPPLQASLQASLYPTTPQLRAAAAAVGKAAVKLGGKIASKAKNMSFDDGAGLTGALKDGGGSFLETKATIEEDSELHRRLARIAQLEACLDSAYEFNVRKCQCPENASTVALLGKYYRDGLAKMAVQKEATRVDYAAGLTAKAAGMAAGFALTPLVGLIVGTAVDAISDVVVSEEGWERYDECQRILQETTRILDELSRTCKPKRECQEDVEDPQPEVSIEPEPPTRYRLNFKPRTVLDPSGIVFEALPAHSLSGVTCTIEQAVENTGSFTDNGDGTFTEAAPAIWEKWNAEEYDQVNPYETNFSGYYAWDVPPGKWRVEYEKGGYATQYSAILGVPPIWLDVNQNMVADDTTATAAVSSADGSIIIRFSKPVLAADIVGANFNVTIGGSNATGSLLLVNGGDGWLKDGTPAELVSIVQYTPATIPYNGTPFSVQLSNIHSYGGVLVDNAPLTGTIVSSRTPSSGGGGSGGGGAPAPRASQMTEKATLAADGGAYALLNGQLQLKVETGIFTADTGLTATLTAGQSGEVSDVYGLHFAVQPADTVQVTLALHDLPPGTDPLKVGIWVQDAATGQWSFVGGAYDPLHNTLTFSTRVNGSYVARVSDASFSDVSSAHWAADYIEILAARQIMLGDQGRARPEDNIIRAEVCALLARVLSANSLIGRVPEVEDNFSDVHPDDWYYYVVNLVAKRDLITGYEDGAMRPLNPITREELAVLLARTLVGTEALNQYQGTPDFADAESIAPYARNAVALMQEMKLLSGDETGFRPQDNASRAEVAKLIYLVLERFGLLQSPETVSGVLESSGDGYRIGGYTVEADPFTLSLLAASPAGEIALTGRVDHAAKTIQVWAVGDEIAIPCLSCPYSR